MSMHNRILLAINVAVATCAIAFFTTSFTGNNQQEKAPDQRVRSINMNKAFTLCGERFPTETNPDVHQRLDAEILKNVYSHSSTILFVERANAYFPIIEPILKEEGVPSDLKYLAVAESGLAPVVSSAEARGVWQFMKATAISFNLEVNEDVDERYHVEKATRAACKYLKKEKQKLGSWILAMAAYNGGSSRISEQLASQRAKSFFDLNLMADETMRYPFRIMAIKEVMENLDEYDYEIEEEHLYEPLTDYQLVEVSGPVPSWGDFARENGVSYRQLKVYNPWLVSGKLANKEGKTYTIKLPAE
jgi:membrane-bound lytic murein transglycosylase D